MRTINLLVCLALCAVSCKNPDHEKQDVKQGVSPAQKQDSIANGHLAVPGEQLGTIKLDMPLKRVVDNLGTPTSGDAAMQKSLSIWDSKSGKLVLFAANDPNTSEGHRIKLIRSTAPVFMTKKGVGPGSTLAEIKKSFDLQKAGTFMENGGHFTLYTTEKGISFEINSDSTCSGLVIHYPEMDPGITYIPLYENFRSGIR